MTPEETNKNNVKKARTYRGNANLRIMGSCKNNNNHLETVKETISENSDSIQLQSSINIKDVNKENEIILNKSKSIDKKEKYSNLTNTLVENDKSTCTDHNNNTIKYIVLNNKFKYYDLFLHNNTKKTYSDNRTDL